MLYDSFKMSDGRHSHFGNIMVVKSNSEGVVVDVCERDLYFIEVLVYGPPSSALSVNFDSPAKLLKLGNRWCRRELHRMPTPTEQ